MSSQKAKLFETIINRGKILQVEGTRIRTASNTVGNKRKFVLKILIFDALASEVSMKYKCTIVKAAACLSTCQCCLHKMHIESKFAHKFR